MSVFKNFSFLCPIPSPDLKLEDRIIAHEGMKQFAYTDTTGHITIGVGRNISSGGRGLNSDEIFILLRNDIKLATNQLAKYPWFTALDGVRRGAIIELVFNLGLAGFLEFKGVISALVDKDYATACKELISSKWYTQVGLNRSKYICSRLSTGSY